MALKSEMTVDSGTVTLLRRAHVIRFDEEDLPKWLSRYWGVVKNRSAGSPYLIGKAPYDRFHRLVVDAPPGILVDHINRDTLDCRKQNLRFADNAQNHWNCTTWSQSGFKGVHKARRGGWEVSIVCRGKRKHLGTFTDPIAAAKVYDAAALELFGEYARINFPAHNLNLLPSGA